MNCKPGDLAVVKSVGTTTPGLAGRFVIVERAARMGYEEFPDFRVKIDERPAWVVRSAADGFPLPCEFLNRGIRTQIIHAERRVILDSLLRPIRPDDSADSDQTQHDLAIHG